MEEVETLIIGAGQAGLTMSHALRKRGHPHLVLERGRVGERWRSERWDGMHFQTPNALVRLPDFPFVSDNPNGFATAAEIADYLDAYATFIDAPVRRGVAVAAVRSGFVAETSAGAIRAKHVVVATGPFQRPIVPPLLPETPGIVQMHARDYRSSDRLPDGAVLVVGAGASGSQIAEELLRAGRRVYFSVGKHRRAPRRYRGQDHIWWWIETGMDRTPPERRPADQAPLVHSGAYGGHTMDFRELARQCMVLLGRATGAQDGTMAFAPDLLANLAHGDAAHLAFMDFVDAHIVATGQSFPADPEARVISPTPDWLHEPILSLDLHAEGIGTVIWATGYTLDFGWIDLPVLDRRGMPIHRLGVTDVPGLHFLGLPFLSKMSSSFLFGVGDDADRLGASIARPR